jgi:hypothetical protein
MFVHAALLRIFDGLVLKALGLYTVGNEYKTKIVFLLKLIFRLQVSMVDRVGARAVPI